MQFCDFTLTLNVASIYLLFLCLFIGYLLRRLHLVDGSGFKILNVVIIYVALPALTLYFVPKIEINASLIYPILMPWINILISWIIFGFIGAKLGWSKVMTGAMIVMTGFGNTSFVGIPIIQALYGEEGIKTVIMVDQPGSFVALTTLGLIIMNIYSNKHKTALLTIMANILKFPPFIAFVVGFVLNFTQIQIPADLDATIKILGNLVVPLALISVGMQLQLDIKSVYWRYVWIGLIFKLLLFPALIFILYYIILNQGGEVIDITLLEAAMPPMITAGIMATGYGLKPKFCSLMLSIGIPLSFITIAFWYCIIHWIG